MCVEEDDIIAFGGTGRKEDEANVWLIIVALIDSDWFEDCATRCVFYRRGVWSDILAEIPHAKQVRDDAMRWFDERYA